MTARTISFRTLAVLTGALLLVLTSPSPAMAACSVTYEGGGSVDPCSGAAPVIGAVALGGAAAAAAIAFAALNYLRGALSASDLTALLAAQLAVAVPAQGPGPGTS